MFNYAERTFGVEIECMTDGRGLYGTEKLLRSEGMSHWADRICCDGSEIEIRSPVLCGTDGFNQLQKVMRILKDNRYSTTDSDGMHCHFDAQDLEEEDIVRIIKSWDENQEIVHKFLGDRFYNNYCGYDYNFNSMEAGVDSYGYPTRGVWSYDGEKCYAIEPRQRLGTIEFRQHYGTLEFADAEAWILLVQAFIKTVKEMSAPMTRVSMEELFSMTRTYKKAQDNLSTRIFRSGERVYL